MRYLLRMKRLTLFSVIALLAFSGFLVGQKAIAQTDDHTAREEAAGKLVWERLQSKEIACTNISDEDFGTLGEYFMGTMAGDSHEAMNERITQIHGEEGEEQIHVALGKRLSGCDTSAAFPAEGGGWTPMMNMMWGGWSSPFNNVGNSNATNNMMNFGYGSSFGGGLGIIFMILWWVLIIAGIVALVRWISNSTQSTGGTPSNKSALDILKERYARGEVNKEEFEEKKKELS